MAAYVLSTWAVAEQVRPGALCTCSRSWVLEKSQAVSSRATGGKRPLEFQTRQVPAAHLQPLSHFPSCQRQRLLGLGSLWEGMSWLTDMLVPQQG